MFLSTSTHSGPRYTQKYPEGKQKGQRRVEAKLPEHLSFLALLWKLASENHRRVEINAMEKTNVTATIACAPSGSPPWRMWLVGNILEIIFHLPKEGSGWAAQKKPTQPGNRM